MKSDDFWNIFSATGSVDSYIKYVDALRKENEVSGYEDDNRGSYIEGNGGQGK